MGLRGSCAEQQLHLVQLRLDEHRRTAHGFTVFVEEHVWTSVSYYGILAPHFQTRS